MALLLNSPVDESCPLAGLESAAFREFRRLSTTLDRSPAKVEQRIRDVFHLDAADPLPLVNPKSLQDYHAYLAARLSFPFRASHCEEMEPLVLDNSVVVIGLCDPDRIPLQSATGIICKVLFCDTLRLPLGLLKVEPRNPNTQVVDDYWYWFWNCR
jgi:hypothetical protein